MSPKRGLGLVLPLLFTWTIAAGQSASMQVSVSQSDVSKNPALVNVNLQQNPGVQLPVNSEFKDSTGATVKFGSLLKGHPVILLPIFYRCKGVCDLEIQGVLNALMKTPSIVPGRDIEVVALGINPKEGPDLAAEKKQEILTEYGKPSTANGWHFLTGAMDQILSVTSPMGFHFTYDPAQDVVNHPSGIMMLTPKGRVSSYIVRPTYVLSSLVQDVTKANAEVIQPKTEDLYFGCVCVDPITGKQSLVVLAVMRLLAIVTLLTLVCSISIMSFRSARRAKKTSSG